jgi:hypothetical protein
LRCELPNRSGGLPIHGKANIATQKTGKVLTSVTDYDLFSFNTNVPDKESGCSN